MAYDESDAISQPKTPLSESSITLDESEPDALMFISDAQNEETHGRRNGENLRENGKYSGSRERFSSGSRVDTGYAWVICLAVCMLNILTDGFCFSLNILFPIFLEQFGESTAATTMIGSVLTGVMLLSGPIVGFLLSRFGARLVCFTGAAVAAAGAVISALAGSVLFLVLSLGLLTGFGFGCMLIANMVSVMTWFVRRRPLAMGITSIVGGSGMFIFPYLIAVLREEYGLEGFFLILGGIILHGCVFGLLLRPSPVTSTDPNPKLTETNDTQNATSSFDVVIFKNWKFDLLLASNFLQALGFFPIMMFVVSRAEEFPGFTPEQAAFLPTVVGMANIGGRLLAMITLDCKAFNKACLMAIMEFIGGTAIALSIFCETYAWQVVFSVAYGIVGGFGMVGLGIVMAELISIDQMAIASGFVTFSIGIAAMSGGPLSGMILDLTNSYTMVFLFFGSILICASALMFLIFVAQRRSPQRKHKN
ncbi:hypothetical protein BV898_06280 [Hypsibius exemplaris]|uniref:Major facilitator superfamily (MFS) profile domain-containing protein n=1 Tax=Hypsibius exemplaris TaxID=2072580 RepID=A0A1W0WX18_HYPEX|nr:hypothetical protein BV898_06280 [Hypsibius exemplaris]